MHMAKQCPITGKTSIVAGGYSNRIRATKFNPTGLRRTRANLQKKKVFVPETGQTLSLTISTRGMKTLKKNGAYQTLRKAGLIA